MTPAHKIEIWVLCLAAALVTAGVLLLGRWHLRRPISLQGAVVAEDADTRKERPVADVDVSGEDGFSTGTARSDASGFFRLTLPRDIRRGHPLTLHFRRAGYRPLDLKVFVGDMLYIAHMSPLSAQTPTTKSETKVGNVRLRYSIKNMSEVNIGSAVQTFQITNQGNVPCKGQHPCSPDGKWKAALGGTSLDAGTGNEFRNARVSCIAGPCPFTRIEADHFSQGGQMITVTARNWSDTATFLVEAVVFHPMSSQVVHQSYPVIFGEALNFTLPSSAEGVNIEADINGQSIIFPIGPSLFLSWAMCNARVNPDQTHVYRCELKPGYRFQ